MTTTRLVLDEPGARSVATAAERFALSAARRVVIAVVDPWGNLLHLVRTEGTQLASSQVAVDKARSAAVFRRPSRDLEDQVSAGRVGGLTLRGGTALTGGVPVVVDGQVVGAVGTSGETPDEDEAVSVAGAAAEGVTTVAVPVMTQALAGRIASAAAAEATARGVSPVVSVVDAGGVLVHQWRPDGAQVASVDVALDKARTAALYRRPSKDFEDQVAGGRVSALALARAVPLQGGQPIVVDGVVAGAVGVSGASSADEDNELAEVAVAAAGDARGPRHWKAADLADLFATGGVFHRAPSWRLDAGSRSGPGDVEVHDGEADVMHVVTGTATIECGARTVEVSPGDVLAVPATVPHRFVSVSDPFHYLVVKVVD